MSNETPQFALTVRSPWAEAIVRGHKRIENRTRKPPEKVIGGRIAIHCGQTVATLDDYDSSISSQLVDAMCYQSTPPDCLGEIIGTARVVGYLRETNDGSAEYRVRNVAPGSEWWRLTDQAYYRGGIVLENFWWFGPVGWLLDDVRELAEPVPARGMPGVWTIDDEAREQMEGT